jgi:hypothetical protein
MGVAMSLSIDYATILTIIIGNGAVIAVATLLINYYTNKSQKQLEARKEAKEYYMTLYGKIAYVQNLITGALGAVVAVPGQEDVGTIAYVKQKGTVELPKSEVINLLNEAHFDLLDYYEQKNCEGYGIFVSRKLRKLLSEFFEIMSRARAVARENTVDYRLMSEASTSLDEIRKYMEKIFGLK